MTRCPQCGSTDLVGGRYFHLIARMTARLRCGCGMGQDGLAAIRCYRQPTPLKEWGRLDGSGDWTTESVREVEPAEEEPIRTTVFCPDCVANADAADWDVRGEGTAEDRLGQSPFIACNGCGAEQLVI